VMYFEKENRLFKYGKENYSKAIESAALCKNFILDKDDDECITSTKKNSCYNCLYRRWTQVSFTCMYKTNP